MGCPQLDQHQKQCYLIIIIIYGLSAAPDSGVTAENPGGRRPLQPTAREREKQYENFDWWFCHKKL